MPSPSFFTLSSLFTLILLPLLPPLLLLLLLLTPLVSWAERWNRSGPVMTSSLQRVSHLRHQDVFFLFHLTPT
uniref:Uncharacterized protein n=1 Tax=Octopus bimaculoides TaxID=37653 RepID=A0A0L8HXZ2_OCTBM